jgi:hypothetical protein
MLSLFNELQAWAVRPIDQGGAVNDHRTAASHSSSSIVSNKVAALERRVQERETRCLAPKTRTASGANGGACFPDFAYAWLYVDEGGVCPSCMTPDEQRIVESRSR